MERTASYFSSTVSEEILSNTNVIMSLTGNIQVPENSPTGWRSICLYSGWQLATCFHICLLSSSQFCSISNTKWANIPLHFTKSIHLFIISPKKLLKSGIKGFLKSLCRQPSKAQYCPDETMQRLPTGSCPRKTSPTFSSFSHFKRVIC